MDAGGQIAERLMNGTVAGDAGHGGEAWRADGHVEMRLAAFAPAAMSTVFFAIILNLQDFRGKGRGQPCMYFIPDRHFPTLPPSRCRTIT